MLWVEQVLVFLELSAELGCVRSIFQTPVCCCKCDEEQKTEDAIYQTGSRYQQLIKMGYCTHLCNYVLLFVISVVALKAVFIMILLNF